MSARPVMVVDDDRDIRESLAEVLEAEGYEVVGAAHGQEALDKLKAGLTPRAVLLDLMMPVMDGYEFYRRWSADPALKAIPLLVVTAGKLKSDSLAEATVLLEKPLNLDRLLELLQKY